MFRGIQVLQQGTGQIPAEELFLPDRKSCVKFYTVLRIQIKERPPCLPPNLSVNLFPVLPLLCILTVPVDLTGLGLGAFALSCPLATPLLTATSKRARTYSLLGAIQKICHFLDQIYLPPPSVTNCRIWLTSLS